MASLHTPTPTLLHARCSIHQLKDSDRLWALEGSSSFLCIPVLAEGVGVGDDREPQCTATATTTAAALLLSYSSTAAAPQE